MTRRSNQVEVIAAVITLVVTAPATPFLMVMVTVKGWPSWWLVVAGVAAAWAGGAVWTLLHHAWVACRVRQPTTPPASVSASGHHAAGPVFVCARAARAGRRATGTSEPGGGSGGNARQGGISGRAGDAP